MKNMAFCGAFFVLLGGVCMACVRVEVTTPPQPSSKKAKIAVSLDGEPAGDVKLKVHFPDKYGQRSLQTDTDGTATLKDLPEGTTCVTAISAKNLSAGLCLVVSARSSNELSNFNMVLAARPSWLLSPEDKVDMVEQSPPTIRMRSLNGTVQDALGGVIPKVEVQVYKRGLYPQNPVATLKTDELGRFTRSLEPGIYTLIIRTRGFRSEFLGVEVAPDGSETELRETLQVASDCES